MHDASLAVIAHSGRPVYPWTLHKNTGSVTLQDIGHGLSHVGCGVMQTKFFISLAQRACLVAQLCDTEAERRYALLQWAPSAYLGIPPGLWMQSSAGKAMSMAYHDMSRAILAHFHVEPVPLGDALSQVDRAIRRDAMPPAYVTPEDRDSRLERIMQLESHRAVHGWMAMIMAVFPEDSVDDGVFETVRPDSRF
jgi:hypothetical protein